MSNEQKYAEVLKELGALLADKNATISSQRWQIQRLEEKLAHTEKEREAAQAACVKANEGLLNALAEIDLLKEAQNNG